MATALLVPLTFFMPPLPAIAAIVTISTMAIFSGDIPGCLLRIPGTPASAAYVDDAYQMTLQGQPELALGIGLCILGASAACSARSVMMAASPAIADFALQLRLGRVLLDRDARPRRRDLHRLGQPR